MKKRLMFPCLLLVSSLTACGGSSGGLVAGGQPYREGAAQAVDPALRAQKEDTIKTVTIRESISISAKASYSGQSYSLSEKLSGSMVVDLEQRTMNGNFDLSYSVSGQSQSTKITFNAYENNGRITITSGSNYSAAFSESTLEVAYNGANYTVYSWNFSRDANDAYSYLNLIGGESAMGYGEEIMSFVETILDNMVISGNPSTGTFDVGLGKVVNFTYSGIRFSYNKFKISYKNCLLDSEVVGVKASGSTSGVSMSINESADVHYSYTFKK